MEIKSSYRFVPVEKEQTYFSPSWKTMVSQDIPLKGFVSGEIDYTLTADTAIFIKGEDGRFCHINGEYFIPGTSIKGCIRSVLEIMSFGHLDETRVKDNKERYAFRDIQDQRGYMQKMSVVYCGWLTDNGEIASWGMPVHISYDDIIKRISNCGFGKFRSLDAIQKYRLIGNTYLKGFFTDPKKPNGAKPYDKRMFCEFAGTGKVGTVIFSGAMQNKKSDFVLLEKDEHKNPITVPPAILKDFQSIYPNYRQIPYDAAKKGRAVFFTLDNKNNVVTIGLSYLHKYYAKNTISDAIPSGMKGNEPDLADVLFGSVKHNLKGRVQFGSARQVSAELLLSENDTIISVLGSPRASYYPTYLQDRATWDTNGSIISGIKRYPIKPRYNLGVLELKGTDREHYIDKYGVVDGSIYESEVEGRKLIPRDVENNEINFDTITQMSPLKEGSTFKGSIRFNNLKPEELGALLSALTFHGQEEECKHSMGQARSHGYGSVSITVDELKVFEEKKEMKGYLDSFERMMNQYLHSAGNNTPWINTIQLKELFAMAKGFSDESLIDVFTPMLLEEFGKAKGNYMRGKDDFSSFSSIARNSQPKPVIIQKQEAPKQAEAIVTFFTGPIKKAKLIEGKNTAPQMLDMNGKKDKFKGNGKEKILVEITKKGLKFIKAL